MARVKQQAEALIKLIGDDQVTEMIENIQNNIRQSTKDTKRQSQATSKLRKSVDGVVDKWHKVSGAIDHTLSIIGSATSAVRDLMEQADVGAKEFNIEKRFVQLTDKIGGAGLALEHLRKKSSDGIPTATLEKLSNKALTAGFSLGQVGEMFAMSAKVAGQSGEDQVEITEQMIQGWVDLSDGVTRAAGAETDAGQSLAKLTTKMQQSDRLLSINTRRADFFNASMVALNKSFGAFDTSTASKQINKWKAALEDLQRATRAAAMEKLGLAPEFADVREIMGEIRGAEADARAMVRRMRAGDKFAPDFDPAAIEAETYAEEVRKLSKVTEGNAMALGLVDIELTKYAKQAVKASGYTTNLFDEKKKLIVKYQLESLLLKKLKTDQAAFNKSIGKGTAATGGNITKSQQRANVAKELIDGMRAERIGTMEAQLAQGKYAASIGESELATKHFQAAIAAVPESMRSQVDVAAKLAMALFYVGEEQESAFDKALKQIEATEKATSAQLDLEIALANASIAMGRGGAAAAHMTKALAIIDSNSSFTAGSLDMVARAAAQVNRALATTLKNQILIEQGAVDAYGQASAEGAEAFNRLIIFQGQLKSMAEVAVRTTKRKTGGGGGAKQKTPEDVEREQDALFQKYKARAQGVLDLLQQETDRVEGAFVDLRKQSSDLFKDVTSETWLEAAPIVGPLMPSYYDAEARDAAFKEFEARGVNFAEQYNDKIADIQERYNKLFQDRDLKKSSKIQEMLKEGLKTEIEELRARFEVEEALRAAALEKEKAYHEARIQQAQFASEIVKGMRSELSQYEMDWAEDQYMLGAALANSLEQMESQLRNFKKVHEDLKKAGRDTGEAWKLAGPAMLAGAGQVAAGFIQNEIAKASVLGIMESAASAASYARGDLIGGSMHAVAAATYFTVAGLTAAGVMRSGGPSSKGAADKAETAKDIAAPDVREEEKRAPVNIIVNFTGSTIVGSDKNRLQRDFAAIISDANRYGDRMNPEAIGD